jgi:hypothetical protein
VNGSPSVGSSNTFCARCYDDLSRKHAAAAEIAIHVQSFRLRGALFCEDPASTATAPTESSLQGEQTSHFGNADYARIRLFLAEYPKIMYRLFCWTQCAIVDRFVEAVRASGPRLEDIELARGLKVAPF